MPDDGTILDDNADTIIDRLQQVAGDNTADTKWDGGGHEAPGSVKDAIDDAADRLEEAVDDLRDTFD